MKKLGYLEMECVSLNEIAELESELTRKGCQFVSYRAMMNEQYASIYSLYGMLEVYDTELVESSSAHGCSSLKEAYELIYGRD